MGHGSTLLPSLRCTSRGCAATNAAAGNLSLRLAELWPCELKQAGHWASKGRATHFMAISPSHTVIYGQWRKPWCCSSVDGTKQSGRRAGTPQRAGGGRPGCPVARLLL